ncbi:MAG TPA: S4 domain-containing protein [Polyangia bacterium]|jgi:23S rRNA pseudouridine2605 synthase|nr:S4 domain-containing protein [Polyangia bacterium]
MRLQRFLAQAGVASRRAAEQLIAGGSVKVNGATVTALGTQVNVRDDRVEVDGRRVVPERPIYRLMLKPRACLATLKVTGDRPTLARFLRDPEPGLQVVAPLDFPAEGLVLLTNDGELAERVAKPPRGRAGIPMTYHLKLQGKVSDDEITRLLRGWKWEGRPIRPQAIQTLAATDKNMWLEMVVDETRPRALKAAGELIRHTVLKISRVRLGGVSFEGLPMGGWRDLTRVEVADLRRRAGLEA